MRKVLKRVVSLLLTLAMLFALTAVGASAATTQKTYTEYTLIGDSIATGLCLPKADGTIQRGASNGDITPTCYPKLICNELGIDTAQAKLGQCTKDEEKFHVYAREGLSSIEARMLLDPDYLPSEDDQWITTYAQKLYFEGADGFAALQDTIVDDIASSDLITVGIGNNDLFMYASLRVTFELYGYTDNTLGAKQRAALEKLDEKIQSMYEEGATTLEMWNTMYSTVETLNMVEIFLEAFTSSLIKGYTYMSQNFPVVMEKIHEINPDATVLVVGMYNAADGLTLSEDLPIDISSAAMPVIMLMDNVMQRYQNVYGYTYVSTMGTPLRTYTPIMSWTSSTYMTELLYGAHPPQEGHDYIKNCIMAAL